MSNFSIICLCEPGTLSDGVPVMLPGYNTLDTMVRTKQKFIKK